MKNEITAKRLKKALDNNNMIPQELGREQVKSQSFYQPIFKRYACTIEHKQWEDGKGTKS